MVKSFSAEEREYLRGRLLEVGRELFGRYGLRKTNIEDLTRAVGIAKGSFYTFFSNKEELFLAAHEQEEEQLREKFTREILGEGPLTRERMKAFLLSSLRLFEESPLLRQLLDKENLPYLMRKIPQERFQQHTHQDREWLASLIEGWQQEGTLRRGDPAVLASTISTFFFVAIHRQEIGEGLYVQTMEQLATLLAEGLVPVSEQPEKREGG